MKKLLLIIFCSLSLSLFAAKENPAFVSADSLYRAGQYEAAINQYRDAMKQHGVSAQLLYNLGNAYYRVSNFGDAVHCYESALKLSPGNKQIKNNLEYVSSKVADQNRAELKGKQKLVDADELTFFEIIHNWGAKDHQTDTWAIFALISFFLAVACAAVYLFCTPVPLRKTGFFSAIVFGALFVLMIILSFSSASYFNSHDEGVITAYSIALKADPGEDAKANTTPLHAGTKVRILEQKDGWTKVRLNSDFIGWIPTSDLKPI